MARITLKLPKKAAATAAGPKATSTRARLAQRFRGAPPPKPAAPPPAPAPAPRSAKPPADRAKIAANRAESRAASPRAAPRPQQQARPAPKPPPKPAPPRSAPHENPDDPRLSKRMSELGLCSRREADEWIENGWVKVNGKVVTTLGIRVPASATIEIDPAASKHQNEQVTIILNKPVGYVSGQPEDGHQPAMVLIKPENRWAEDPSRTKFLPGHLRGLAPAGRLDIDSTGLIVFTQDGRVAKRLIGADSEVEKEYLVRVEGTLSEEGLEKLRHGLELDGVKLKPAKVSWSNEDQLRFVLREGRKRQIRRMCEMVGLTVTGLKRVRSGGVPLGPLPLGQWRYLRKDEKF